MDSPLAITKITARPLEKGRKGRWKMQWFQRTNINFIVTCVVIGVLTSASYAAPPSDRCILIKVQVADRDDVATLTNMGLDIWEYREGGLIIRVTDNERKQVIESGFTIETITEDVYEYTEKIRKEQISMFAEPTSAKYHSYDEVITELIALEDSGVARTYIIGSTHEGRDILAVKISDNPSDAENEPGAIFLGCHHAREWISVEVPLYIAQYLADNYETDAEVKHLVDSCEIWIVPVVNPDGYEYSRTVDRTWRKNRRDNGDGTFGVDLNRNYSYMWGGPDASPTTSSEAYRGPYAFSEPETQAVRDLVLADDFRVLMSYHNYGQQIYYPWAYTWEPCSDYIPMSSMYLKMRNLINEMSGAIYTSWTEQNGYLIGGETGDWSYGELGIYSFGIELPPSSGGFVLVESRIMPTCEENLPAALYLISLSAENGGIENPATGTTYSSIQFAINEASEGDEILINPGLYQENILFKSKNLTLRSKDPNDPDIVGSTVIEGVQQYPTITMSSSRDSRDGVCVLDGLTIIGGEPGISCRDVSPIIRNCFIESNGSNALEFSEGYEPITIDYTILTPGQVVPALVAYWSLDEAEGIAAHNSFFDNYAYIVGDPVWLPADGKAGGALQLDGIDDYLSTPFILDPVKSSLSAFAWIKGGSPGQVILSQTGDFGGTWLGIDPSEGKLMTGFSEMYFGALVSETVITDGQWHQIGLVYDLASLHRRLYVDGALVAEDATVVSGIPSDGGMYIGASKDPDTGTFFSGMIDDVRVYTRALNAEEIKNLPLYHISSAADSGEIESPTTGRVKNLTAGKTYNNIRFAITDALEGDEIVISEGIYEENIYFKGKNLIFRSKDPNDPSVVAATVINGNDKGSVVTFSGGEDASCVLAGFTITGGNAENGGGIYCGNKSAPKITNCIITKNSATMGGGGIYIEGGSIGRVPLKPALTNCTIINNSASVAGGGLYNQFSNPTLTNCTFSGNSTDYFGGGICFSSGSPVLTNCILWSDIPDEISMLGGTPVVTYSDVQGGFIGEGNINADPLFADAANGDYHLQSQAGRWDPVSGSWMIDGITSPCIDAGDPGTVIGLEPLPNGGRINMGAYGGTNEASKSP